MLPWCECAKVDGGEATDGDSADAVEKRINVADVILSVACIEYTRGDKGGKCAASTEGCQSARSIAAQIGAHKKRMWTL